MEKKTLAIKNISNHEVGIVVPEIRLSRFIQPNRSIKMNKEQLEEAAKAEKDAKELETQYRAKLDKVEDEAEEMLSDARKKALDKEKEIVAKASDEAQTIKARAEHEVELEKNKVRDEMKQEIVHVASAMAGKFVAASMDEDKQAQLIDETLKEMGDETWQN